jgi:hypothetical protein
MGGERETTVEKKEPKSKSEKATIGKFRIHQKDSEVHVHDDAGKLKASVPVAAWWKMWDKLRNEPGTWTWIDPQSKTRLTIQTVLDDLTVDVTISLSSTQFGDTWDKLNTFTKKK